MRTFKQQRQFNRYFFVKGVLATIQAQLWRLSENPFFSYEERNRFSNIGQQVFLLKNDIANTNHFEKKEETKDES